MSKQVPQPVYGLKGGTKNFDAKEHGFNHEQHRAHNRRIEEIDKKFGIHHTQR